jgi:hypothetical protein
MKVEAAAQVAGVGAASALTMELLGLPIAPIIWGLIGGVVGSSWAPAMPAWRTAVLYPASALVAAMLAQWAAHQWFNDDRIAVNGGAALLAVLFHPIMAALVQSVPAIVAKFAGKVEVTK